MTNWPIRKFAAAFILMLCVCFAPAARAQEPDMAEPPNQIELNPDMVKRFVATFDEIKKWQKANDTTSKTTDDAEEEEEGGSDNASALAMVQAAKSSAEVKAILKKNNFDDLDKFAQVAQSAMLAYYYADPESGLAGQEASIQKTIEQVKNDKSFSEAEKAEAVKNLESEYQSVQKLKPLPANIAVVKPFVPEIKAIVESE